MVGVAESSQATEMLDILFHVTKWQDTSLVTKETLCFFCPAEYTLYQQTLYMPQIVCVMLDAFQAI